MIYLHGGVPACLKLRMELNQLLKFEDVKLFSKKRKSNSSDYLICWGQRLGSHCGVLETGFFLGTGHMDTRGLYQNCSLNLPQALSSINSFVPPVPLQKLLPSIELKFPQSIDPQFESLQEWNGVVLALQYPADHSILSVARPSAYLDFVEGACKHYGKRLFLKMHPAMFRPFYRKKAEPWVKAFKQLSTKYGIKIGLIDSRIFKKCDFVLVYNSTIAVDAFLAGAKVAQFAPGYFWRIPPIQYTDHSYPNKIQGDITQGFRFISFLLWRYCFPFELSGEQWHKLLLTFASSKGLFPLPQELSYGYKLKCKI